jgi:hypothetical protein
MAAASVAAPHVAAVPVDAAPMAVSLVAAVPVAAAPMVTNLLLSQMLLCDCCSRAASVAASMAAIP